MTRQESAEPPFRTYRIQTASADVYVTETGSAEGEPMLFLHGWPQTSLAFRDIMLTAGESGTRAIAVDLPGVGGSRGSIGGEKSAIADVIHAVVELAGWRKVTLVGHDVGGQVVFSYLTRYPDELERAVIMDAVIPGIPPWDEVARNPHIWHFAFHAIPDLPEYLVAGKQAKYFDWFFDAISHRPDAITRKAREAYADAYANPKALSAGFNWYRAFAADARENAAFAESTVRSKVPVVYLRGEHEGGEIGEYVKGIRDAGMPNTVGLTIPSSGHYAPEEQPGAVWRVLSDFLTAE